MKKLVITSLAGFLTTGNAFAGEVGQWYTRISVAHTMTNDSSDISINGVSISERDIETSDSTTAALDVGLFVSEHWSTNFVAVFPNVSEITAGDSLEALEASEFTYFPLYGFVNYHLASEGSFQPFLGVGFVYNLVSGVEVNNIEDIDVSSDVGLAFRAGFDLMLAENWGTFASVSKSFVDHEITGQVPVFGKSVPISVEAELDPWLFQAGITFRY